MGPTPQALEPARYRFGIFEADACTGELTREGVKVKIQEQPFQILVLLIERAGDIVTREEIIQRLWPPATFVDFDHSLNVAIKKLREALRDDADNPRFIETKPKRGYRFIAPVQKIGEAEPTSPATPRQPPAPHDLPTAHRGLTRTLLTLIQLLYLTFYVIALVRLRHIDEAAQPFVGGSSDWVTIVVLVTAVLGIPVRLYLLSAVLFDYPQTGVKFLRLFPAIFILDMLWALSPFLAAPVIGIGLAFGVCAAMLYLPFSQRTLMRMTYPHS